MSHKIIEERICNLETCMKVFQVTTRKKGQKFCSRECATLGLKQNKKHERTCVNCNNVFTVRAPSEPNKFCSRACAKKVNLGRKHSEDTKLKMSASRKGRKAWNKGISPTEETKAKLSKAGKGRIKSAEHRKKIGEANSKRIWTLSSRIKLKKSKSKGLTTVFKTIRRCTEYTKWRKHIFERDDFTCQTCNTRGGKVNADHIKPFALILHENKVKTFEEALACKELWDTNNGRTLCVKCHRNTDTFGARTLNVIKTL